MLNNFVFTILQFFLEKSDWNRLNPRDIGDSKTERLEIYIF